MPRSKNTEIRASRTSRLLGYIAGFLMKLWSLTLRYNVNDEAGIVQPIILEKAVIFALWHNRIFTMPPIWQRTGGKKRSTVVLTSASKDGTTLATAMQLFGLGAIRGSSSRRAVSALIGMKKALLSGYDVCVTPDGPKGPRYSVQPGVIKIAQATGTDIIPIHIKYSAAWRLNTWDRFVIPKPFSRVTVVFDTPLNYPKEMSQEEFEVARRDLETRLIDGSDDR
ncbi:lysophospholipid acyltransferase family protein [Luteolibacter algae]|uniref:Lysophospholipid acyltransferase family protein n=1 Tax=Luteolibacter algae TaxID=454151 RepID=A0ABW5D836_9BACT